MRQHVICYVLYWVPADAANQLFNEVEVFCWKVNKWATGLIDSLLALAATWILVLSTVVEGIYHQNGSPLPVNSQKHIYIVTLCHVLVYKLLLYFYQLSQKKENFSIFT